MGYKENKPFSWLWVVLSFGIYILLMVFLGGVIGGLLLKRYVPYVLRMNIEVVMMILSYLLGGFLVGLLSPKVRIWEPATGAFLAVLSTFLYSLFTPVRFFGFSLSRIIMGGGIAFVLAFLGAQAGEKLAAALGNSASKTHFD